MRTTKDKMAAEYTPVSERLPGPVGRAASYPARIQGFLHEVRMELHNVTWPTWADVRATTVVVLIAVFFFGFYLGVVLDVPFANFMSWLLKIGKGLVG